jgi:hypothetical protein
MSARVVCVNHVGVPGAKHSANPSGCRQIPVSTHPHGGSGNTGRSESPNERSVWCRDDERLVTLLTLPAGQEIHLSLATAPFAAGVQVQYAQRCGIGHIRRMSPAAGGRNAHRAGRPISRT